MTLQEILQDVCRRTHKPPIPDAETTARLLAFINQRHRTLLTMPGLNQLRDASTTFTSVAATARVALPQALVRVQAISETTQNLRLTERSRDWLRTVNSQTDSGTPIAYIPIGYEAVAVAPSNASAVYVKSSSASDVGTCVISGTRTGGILGRSTVTMTGTSAVQVGTFSDWEAIHTITVSPAAVGSITVHEDSGGGTTLAQISIGRTRPYYFVIHLWPTPADVRTYQCDFTREILDLAQDTDEPLLPTDYHDLLAIGARLDEYERMDDSRSARAQHEWTERYRSLQYFLHARASERLIPMPSHGRLGYSNLGGWFPADGGW